jgi:hypothetical protein
MRRLLIVGAGLAAMVLMAGTAAASHSWGGYHWARSVNPLQLEIGSNVGQVYAGNLSTAVGDWDRSDVLALSSTAGAGLSNCGPVLGRVEVCDDYYGYRQGGWLGVATIWLSGDHITEATVKLGPPSNLQPNKHDYDELDVIYSHLDGSGGGGGGGGGGNCPPRNKHCSGGGIGNAPPLAQASRSNGSVYVDHLPDGRTRVTHILWALETN